ncbi:MAG: COX15/CtaA family protein [Phycisphaerales bacterium]
MVTTQVRPLAHSPAAAAITLGFAIAVFAAAVGFFTHLPELRAPSPMVFFALAATILLVAGHFGARVARNRSALVGAGGGLAGGIVLLMMLGSVLAGEDGPDTFKDNAATIVLGWLAFAAALGAVGGALGGYTKLHRGATLPDGKPRDWHATFLKVTAFAFVPLIVVGGAVTSKEAGMAVPDWPASFGHNMFLYPLSKMTGGIYYEHAHRLIGSLVGATVLAAFLFTLIADRRKWMWGLALLGGVFVAIQGYIGGARVFLDNRVLAALHGVSGQLIFALFVAIAAFASVRWKANEPKRPGARPGCGRFITVLLLVLLTLQLLLGVMTRHFEGTSGYMHALITHMVNSVLVAAVAVGAGLRTRQCLAPSLDARSPDRLTRVVGTGVMHTTILQMLLGVGAAGVVFVWRETDPWPEVLITTAHQANGAALLALATLAAVWTRRLVLPKSTQAPTPAVAAT